MDLRVGFVLESLCINNDGSFTCTCAMGFTDHVPYSGCRDIDECTEG